MHRSIDQKKKWQQIHFQIEVQVVWEWWVVPFWKGIWWIESSPESWLLVTIANI